MRKVRYYQVQIDLQTVPDGEWITVVKSDAFEDETDARRWEGHYTIPPLPMGWDIRSVLVALDSHKEPIEDVENIYECQTDDLEEDEDAPSPEEEKQLKYLLNKEKCCPLDKEEQCELQDLLDKYGYPDYQ